jgi:hypothetical protein
MSTVGTLYDKTIKNGYAKLLAVTEVVSTVSVIDFVSPFTSTYDNYIFELESLQSDNTGAFFMFYPSNNSGASWLQSENLWSLAGVWSHREGATYGSTIYSGSRVYMQQTYDAQYGPLPMSGIIYFNRGAPGTGGEKQFLWTNVYRSPSYGAGVTWGNGAANISYAMMTGIRFLYSSGNIIAGAIRVFGIKTGV